MKTTLVCLTCGLIALSAGCGMMDRGMEGAATDQAVSRVRGKGMTISVSLPKRDWQIGEAIPVEATAVNNTGSAIDVVSPSGAPILVRVMRPSKGSFEQVRLYPSSATSNIINWTLPAHGSRTYKLMVPVEPDWPVAEPLRLSAELNGYPKYSPGVTITVRPGSLKR